MLECRRPMIGSSSGAIIDGERRIVIAGQRRSNTRGTTFPQPSFGRKRRRDQQLKERGWSQQPKLHGHYC
jgi:hypothetical protein